MIKKQLLLILLFGFAAPKLFAQSETGLSKRDTTVYISVEQSAQYPKGMEKLYTYLGLKARLAATDTIVGYTLAVSFVIEKNGSLSNFKIIKSISPNYDKRFIADLKAAGKWIPGKNQGKTVRQQYTLRQSVSPSEN